MVKQTICWILLALSISSLNIFTSLLSYANINAPPGAPGIPHRWAPALKQAIGTAYEKNTAHSPVWFTVAQGILTEVYYPHIDQAQIGDLQFLVTDGVGYFSEQKRDTVSEVNFTQDGASVLISGRERAGHYSFEQAIITDSLAPVVRIKTTLKWNHPGLRAFILFKPAINNTGAQNLGWVNRNGLFATKKEVISNNWRHNNSEVYTALMASVPWVATSVGYVGFSDGWQDLSRHFRLTEFWQEAGPGNVALTGELKQNAGEEFNYELALAFGSSESEAETYAKTALSTSFQIAQNSYDSGWFNYINELQSPPYGQTKFLKNSSIARRSAITIKMHEDKLQRGAIAASLSKPSLPGGDGAMDGAIGYHIIWPRDLYYAAMGLLAAGDARTPVDVLTYYRITQRSDGSWAQNFWVDGTPHWRSLQMDEISFPILLTNQLAKRGVYNLRSEDLDMVRKAADFIMTRGPTTPQDRWEEMGGYLPSTLAAEIAALKAASKLTGQAIFARAAEEWQAQIEAWTLVPQGPHGTNYYLRVSTSGNPVDPEPIELANGVGKAFAAEILDGGFLELVRRGVRPANDPNIINTLLIYEAPESGLAQGYPQSGGALGYRRYNRDAYGPDRAGGFWPLLAGERGHYAVMRGDLVRAQSQLSLMERSALRSEMIPEQTVTADPRLSVGLGVACPLVWAHAENILLHRSIEDGVAFDAD